MSYPRPPSSPLAWRHEPLVKRYHVLFDVQHAQGKSASGRVRDVPAQGAPRAAFCSSRLGRTAFDADTGEVHPDVLRPGYARADFATVKSAPPLTPPVGQSGRRADGRTGPPTPHPSRRADGRTGPPHPAPFRTGRREDGILTDPPVCPSGWEVRGGGPVRPSGGAVVSRGRVRYC